MNIKDALKEVLRNALIHDGLARGLREAVKALDKYVPYNMGALNEPRPHPFCWLLSCWAYNAYAGARLSYVFWQRIAPKPVTSG